MTAPIAPLPGGEGAASALTMEQHAGIAAALAEGFALSDVLAQELVDEGTFRAADVAWKVRLVTDARGEGALFAAYQARRAEAEDWLRRPVKPLDEDLGAWLGFTRAWAAATEPFELLAGAGMTLADVGRLGRRWEAALARDPALAKRAAKLAAEARMPARITVGTAELRPFPWSPKPPARTSPDGEGPPPQDTISASDATGELIVVPVIPSYLRDRADNPPGPGSDGASSPVPRPTTPSQGASAARALPSYARRQSPDATAPVFYLPAGAGLPFSEDAPSPAAQPEPSPAKPAQSGETVSSFDVAALAARPATPFQQAAAPMGTVAVFELPKGPALPFVPPSPAARGKAPAAPPNMPEPAAPARKSAPLGETLPLTAPAPSPPVPFTPAPPPAAAPGSPGDPPTALSLEEHAALCAEIAFRPDRTEAALARRRLDPPSKAAHDARIHALRARDPSADATWNRAYQTAYTKLVMAGLTGGRR